MRKTLILNLLCTMIFLIAAWTIVSRSNRTERRLVGLVTRSESVVRIVEYEPLSCREKQQIMDYAWTHTVNPDEYCFWEVWFDGRDLSYELSAFWKDGHRQLLLYTQGI